MVNVSCLCRMKEIQGVRTIKLVDVGGVLRMGSDLLLMSVWRSIGDGFTGKGDSDV